MSSGCGDVLSLEDLKTAKKHQIFEAEVITGRAGGVASGASIDFATNANTGQVQKTMPAILRDIGFRPAPFDFVSGGTIGANDRDLAVLWPLPGGDGDWYYWEGALPKVIPASSTPASTGGVADGAWRPVGDITLRGQLAGTNGANLVKFTPLSGPDRFMQDYLREGYIRVSSRDELIAAQTFIKSTILKRTEVRLSRNFSPWTAAQTDIDISYVTITGEGNGVRIDATGIPNVSGNYFLRIYDSAGLAVGGPQLAGVRISGFHVTGPGRSSSVGGILYHSPSAAMGNFTTDSITVSEFAFCVSIQQNAYILAFTNCYFQRANGVHFQMPAGFTNYGENITLQNCTIAVSAGIGVQNGNAVGKITLQNCSVDYTGRMLDSPNGGGKIVMLGGHMEFDNTSNPLNGVPITSGNSQHCAVILENVEVVCTRTSGFTQPYLATSAAGGIGVLLRGIVPTNIVSTTGDLFGGDGISISRDMHILDGSGNPRVSLNQPTQNSLTADFSNEQSTPADWYIDRFQGSVTSRTAATNITLANVAAVGPVSGTQVLRVTNSTAGSNHGVACIVPFDALQQPYAKLSVRNAGGNTAISITFRWVAVTYYDATQRPVISRASANIGATRTIVLNATADWQTVVMQVIKNQRPLWASHLQVSINSSSIAVGNGYEIDDTLIFSA